MSVVYYDILQKMPLGNSVAKGSLSEVLTVSDFVTLHVPETAQTANMIRDEHFAMMRPGSFLINASRGSVVCFKVLPRPLHPN